MSISLPARVITLDMDGTAFDPFACCNVYDGSLLGDTACRHTRKEIVTRVKKLATLKDAEIVVLSYRSSYEEVATREWLASIGLDVAKVYHLGSPDLKQLETEAAGSVVLPFRCDGQARYKAEVVWRLRRLGVTVVASFDDNEGVCEAMRRSGVPIVHQVPYQVELTAKQMSAARAEYYRCHPNHPRRSRSAGAPSSDRYNGDRGKSSKRDSVAAYDKWEARQMTLRYMK